MSQEQQEKQQEVQESEHAQPVSELSEPLTALAHEQVTDEGEVYEEPTRKKGKGKGKRRVRRTLTQAELEAVMPRPSYWPVALAFSVVLFLFGVIGNSIVFMVPGILFIIVCAVGWGLERH